MCKFENEGRKRAERVHAALEAGKVTSFRWNDNGDGCEFYYDGADRCGTPCKIRTSLDRDNAIYAFSGITLLEPKVGRSEL